MILPEGKPVQESLAMLGVQPGCGFIVERARQWNWIKEPWDPRVLVCVQLSGEQTVELATEGCVLAELSHWYLTADGGSAAHKHLLAFALQA